MAWTLALFSGSILGASVWVYLVEHLWTWVVVPSNRACQRLHVHMCLEV